MATHIRIDVAAGWEEAHGRAILSRRTIWRLMVGEVRGRILAKVRRRLVAIIGWWMTAHDVNVECVRF